VSLVADFSIRSMPVSALTRYFAVHAMRGLRALHAEVKDVQCMQGVFG